MTVSHSPICWCGNRDLLPFSPDYSICTQCQTLVCSQPVGDNISNGSDDQSLYGKSYWFEHQQNDLGYSNILSRSRSDVPERVLHWLHTFLKYKTPPGKTLELGCSHGGFVSLLQWTGFQASGLELSPWVVEYAKETFRVPMYLGKIEDQNIEPHSLDAIILMDVVEHLPAPVETISYAATLLNEHGFLMIQTPQYKVGKTYEEFKSTNDPFLAQFKPPEHIYLFNATSVRKLLETCGLNYVSMEQAFFSQYDMFLVASPSPLTTNTQQEIDQSLLNSPGGRLVLALLDKDAECKILNERLKELEIDRSALMDQIQQYSIWLKESEADRAALRDQIQQYSIWLKESEADRAALRDQIQQYSIWLKESEADRAALRDQIQQYSIWLKESDADRAARLVVIKNQEQIISDLNTDLTRLQSSFLFKVGKRFDLWK